MAESFKVQITQSGRGGSIHYVEGLLHRISFDWEFGGGNAVAMVFTPSSEQWGSFGNWAQGRRDEIIKRTTDEVIRQKASNCVAEIETDTIINIVPRR
jgi:hypothetical protein